jgi:hypothetical protein
MGVAISYSPTGPGSQTITVDTTGATLAQVNLAEGVISSTGDITFSNNAFTIGSTGHYFVGYGLCGLPNETLMGDYGNNTVSTWISVQREPSAGSAVMLGATPLAVTQSLTSLHLGSSLLSGFGQLQATFYPGDAISLWLYLNNGNTTTPDDGAAIIIEADQITDPASEPINNGGTLSIIKLP